MDLHICAHPHETNYALFAPCHFPALVCMFWLIVYMPGRMCHGENPAECQETCGPRPQRSHVKQGALVLLFENGRTYNHKARFQYPLCSTPGMPQLTLRTKVNPNNEQRENACSQSIRSATELRPHFNCRIYCWKLWKFATRPTCDNAMPRVVCEHQPRVCC